MPLYATVRRVDNELIDHGLAGSAPLRPEQLFPFDQIHYHGVTAVQRAADTLRLAFGQRVLDVGAGLGGPARYLAHRAGVRVTAVELQVDMHARGSALTRRCGLDRRIDHVLGDILACPLPAGSLDAAVSWLAIHHIPERRRVFERINAALRPGGRVYVEDLFIRAPLGAPELDQVNRLLYGVTMTSLDEYRGDLEANGFVDVALEDVSDDWGAFCAGRVAAWSDSRERQLRVHGGDIVETLDRFFSGVSRLFDGGHLGGVRLTARKP